MAERDNGEERAMSPHDPRTAGRIAERIVRGGY